ncbi:MAG TPA: prolyl oligopeptidase family serine peptidase [Gemmatimonadaceae bacterium]|nr:prolyl oligopeptidase family serine peptidase [Gemmatimonadaceae bacterium]
MKSLTRVLVLAAVVASPLVAQTPRAFQVSDWYKIARVAGGVLSPDGNTLAFTVTTVREAENRRHTEIWIQPLTGGPSKRMTSPEFESTAPRWSDDGKTLYFTSQRPHATGTQWGVRIDEAGEPFETNAAGAAGGGRGGRGGGRGGFGGDANAGARPLDKSFTITAGATGQGQGAAGRGGRGRGDTADSTSVPLNDPYSRMAPLSRPPNGSITKPVDPARFDGKHFIDVATRSNDAGFVPSTGRGGRGGAADSTGGGRGGRGNGNGLAVPNGEPLQLFIQRGSAERKAITNTNYSHLTPSVSPDGKWVVFAADPKLRSDSLVRRETDSLAKLPPNRARDEADRNDQDLYVLPVAACETNSADCKPKKIEYFGAESNIIWSADSKQLAFVGRPGRLNSSHLFLASVDGGKAVDLLGTWKYEPGTIEWFKDGKIRMTTTTGGSTGLWQVDPSTKQISPILAGRREVTNIVYDIAKTKMVYTSSDVSHLAEYYVSDINGQNEKKLTGFNDKLQSEVQFSDAERFTYKSVDNLEIEGWLMKPYGYQAGKKYPLVIYIHGGPHSAYGEGWFDEFQSLAGGGFFVLFTNPRGSNGTNGAFTNASRGDWGGKDYQDLMKAVDLMSVRADVDSNRMGVTGGSYGGYMTAWVTTKTNRFKAAETDRMISEWTYWWGASDAQSLTNNEFFGRPWENQAMYDSLSPIRHVKNVKTPTLMVQSEDDFRTPMGNADLWYTALRTQGVPAEFVRYPRSTHELSRSGEPWLLVDRLGRIRQWFTYWLIDGGPAKGAAATQSQQR